MDLVFVRPREGLSIRAADGRLIPPEGLAVPRDLYVERRLRDGDLSLAEPPAEPDAPRPRKEKS